MQQLLCLQSHQLLTDFKSRNKIIKDPDNNRLHEKARRACGSTLLSGIFRHACGGRHPASLIEAKTLDSSQKHAGMTVSERLFEFKSICSLTMSKAAWYARMRHVRDYYSGQQYAFAGMTSGWLERQPALDNISIPLYL